MKVKIYVRWILASMLLGAVTMILWGPETTREWLAYPLAGTVFWGAMLTPMLNADE
jgi:hypothetical protein